MPWEIINLEISKQSLIVIKTSKMSKISDFNCDYRSIDNVMYLFINQVFLISNKELNMPELEAARTQNKHSRQSLYLQN